MQPSGQAVTGTKLLCIEDEHFIGELYTRALTRAGYSVTVESDGRKGLDLALTDQFDIILLDLMIPSLSGSEVLAALRDPSLPQPLHAKIIVTTNLEQRQEVRDEIERHADGYLIKAEITPRELVEFLSHLQPTP